MRIVAPRDGSERPYPLWLWPNLLSLDAPALAMLWQEFLSVIQGIPLRPAGRVVLGLTVWSIYLADRLLDARTPRPGQEAARHRFYRDHFRGGCALLAAVLGVDAVVTLTWLRPGVLLYGLIPFSGVVVYLLLVHSSRDAIAKEPWVAFLFTVGTFLVAWTNGPGSRRNLLGPAVAFFLLCLANAVSVEKWEGAELREAVPSPHPVTSRLVRALPHLVALLLACSLMFGGTAWYHAIAASSAAIGCLLWLGKRLSLDARSVLVDAALLSPAFFLLR